MEREEVIRSLLDMGFSDVHVSDLLGIRPGVPPRQLLDVVSELILLGVHPEPVCAVLKKSPRLLKLPAMQMKQRSGYLQRLGLREGTAQAPGPRGRSRGRRSLGARSRGASGGAGWR